jgi:hypothetical protein
VPATVPGSLSDPAHPNAVRRVDAALLALDERLFNPAGWFVIDVNNQPVKGVAIPTLQTGLELVGRGRIAAVVGRLRVGAAVVDVDVKGDFGAFIGHEVAGWLEQQGYWVLLRPSGGEDGRCHVFLAHPEFSERRRGEVAAYLEGLSAEFKLRGRQLDLRDAVRPLSSPHRRGAVTRPKGDLRQAARGLKRVFPNLPDPEPLRKRPQVTARTPAQAAREAAAGNVVPLFLHGGRRHIAPQWRQYLISGVPPADDAYNGADRSLTEAGLTRELVWAVGDPKTAWQLIRESHPKAMTKAKHRGWSWWVKHVWNAAVDNASAFSPHELEHPRTEPPADVLAAVAAARRRLHDLMWTVPARTRPGLLLVGHHVLDRIARTGQLRVPCPERDLVLDTGISDRKTVRAALRVLDGPIGVLHKDCLSTEDRSSTSFEFSIEAPRDEGCREIPPPSFHPPLPVRGLWATLPRASHSVWRTLLASSTPLGLAELAEQAGLVSSRGETPSRSHLARVKQAAVALAQAGLARVDEEGRWRAGSSPRSVRVEERAAVAYGVLSERVEDERRMYRAGQTSSWSAARARALKAQRAKEKSWWDGLDPREREIRRAMRRSRFDQLTISEQAALKATLAEGRQRAGVDELEHHLAWARSLSPDEYVARSLERKERFARLSGAERGLAVAAWTRHRTRYGLPSPAASAHGITTSENYDELALVPDGAAERDAAFLRRQVDRTLPGLDVAAG